MGMKVDLGARWKSDHIVRRDTETGTFEELNSPMFSDTEAKVQAALLRYPTWRAELDLHWKWIAR